MNKKISLLAMSLALMIIMGWIFESFPPLLLASYVKPSPAEAILIFILCLYGLKISMILLLTYIVMLFSLKGVSPSFIEEISFLMASLTMIITFYFANKKKWNYKIKAFATVLTTSVVMTVMNAYWITPTYLNLANAPFSTYKSAFPNLSFLEVLALVIKPLPIGTGILHGNIVKYTFVMVVGHYTIKTFKNIQKQR